MSATLRASHIAIGTELTSGQTLNTNSRYIAEFLRDAGVKNQIHVVVPDTKDLILQAFDFTAKESDWLFVYGGLGPTSDDFTRNMVSEWTGKELQLHEPSWINIQNILSSRGFPIREFQKQQAYFPEGAHIMENAKGTAHGFHVSAKGKEIFVLPGPPKEVQSIFENYLKSWINQNAQINDSQIVKIWNTIGLGESEVSFQIENLVKDFDVVVGYRIHLPYVEVKITYLKSQSEDIKPLNEAIEKTLLPILVYRNQYPYPDFFKSLLSDHKLISIVDNATNDGFFADLRTWIPDWTTKNLSYFNQETAESVRSDLEIKIIRIPLGRSVQVSLKTTQRKIEFDISIESFLRMPIERQPLFIKEMVYKELVTRFPLV